MSKKLSEKQKLKVLEIIKKKKVDIEYLMDICARPIRNSLKLAVYNYYNKEKKLTMTELHKLKTWLEENE